MSRRQFLWIDGRGATCHYLAPNNIRASAGDKGTLSIWQWPLWRHENTDLNWRLEVDDWNYVRQFQGRSLRVSSDGTVWTSSVDRYTSVYDWDHMVYTWDFSVPGAGQLGVYWNGVAVGTPVNNASAPLGAPTRLVLGAMPDTETRGPSTV